MRGEKDRIPIIKDVLQQNPGNRVTPQGPVRARGRRIGKVRI